MSVRAFLAAKAAKTEQALDAYFATLHDVPDTLREAMRYSLFAGGKRLRPALALGAAEIVCGKDTAAMPAACAIEMIHTYSLIHDDLPSMDDDALRRGKPTSHVVYGEAIAILAGDALLTMAFDVAARANDPRVLGEIARAAGAEGMVGGQVIDLQSEDKRLSLEQLRHLHACKTGALIRVSVRAGAILGGATESQLDALTHYGQHIGLAFQIADDILDITSTEEVLGKPIGSDIASQKSTYPALVGMDESRRLANEAVSSALDALKSFGAEADTFRALARYIVERDS
ncbi:MAG: polyprenyl synthetase family protein [Candidatus Hydrogenedentes bacterium]|nr:polyprenyl synthetase family protein [Candidatus Hydrogenedentota bacterium]